MKFDFLGEFLALALENSDVWILKLDWKVQDEKKWIKEVNHCATLEGHRSIVTGLHYIGKTIVILNVNSLDL